MKNHRRLLFWLAFFALAGVVVAIPEYMDDSASVVAPVVRPVPGVEPVQLPAPLTGLRAAAALESALDPAAAPAPAASSLFAARTWVLPPPPPPPVPPPGPPPPPAAPPLPFRLLGRLDDALTVKAFLQKGEQVYTVGVGDVIDGTYRVDSLQTGQMVLMYLPLSIPQTLTGGGEP